MIILGILFLAAGLFLLNVCVDVHRNDPEGRGHPYALLYWTPAVLITLVGFLTTIEALISMM